MRRPIRRRAWAPTGCWAAASALRVRMADGEFRSGAVIYSTSTCRHLSWRIPWRRSSETPASKGTISNNSEKPPFGRSESLSTFTTEAEHFLVSDRRSSLTILALIVVASLGLLAMKPAKPLAPQDLRPPAAVFGPLYAEVELR